ncbi:hypothetical protein PPYR_13705 [Photinus pyralis]|uniref:Coiled-coil domain-containing protein 40 n=1 Tax=Photinus pyralis TaxID=7054 RepID=A0A5N4A9T2_PHOPY|nr:coiled-coil domain-containing protein 40-like [Photinus pyralis]KAB0794085.1 hypothetical protein PPYR_13705 [Photinus pyralis]
MSERCKEKQTKLKFTLPSSEEPPQVDVIFSREDDDLESKPDDPILLDANHPLLEHFQKTLKHHLERQIEHLRSEVFELETGAKKKMIAREQLGLETYEAQQVVNKQQRELEMCISELDHICAATEEMELELDEAKKTLSQKRLDVLEAERNELRLRTEVEGMNLLAQQMKDWEEDAESELIINQRIFGKTKKDKSSLIDEKRQLDAIIFKLMTETWRLEEELETMDMQIRVKEEERERLAESVANSNIDLETIASEHRSLLHSWNSLVVAISHRDKAYMTSKEELHKLEEEIRVVSAEVEQTKKLCKKEMERNERLTDFKLRLQADVDSCARSLEIEAKKRFQLETEMEHVQALTDQTELDIKKLTSENTGKKCELSALISEFEKLGSQKATLDNDILKMLEDQMTNDKAAKYLHKLVKKAKEKNRTMNIALAKIDNTNSRTLMDIEAQKCENEEIERFLSALVKQANDLEDELRACQREEEGLRCYASKKQRDMDVLTNKLEKVINQQGGFEVSPEELKIVALQKNIEEVQESTKKLRKFWLRQQGYVVNLSEQRQNQINDFNMLKKQLQLLIQKNLKINDELENYRRQEEVLSRSMVNLQNKITIMNELINKAKGNKIVMEKDTDTIQFDYSGKLHDAEMESLKIEADIADIEEDKMSLSKELIDVNREALVWEKKIQMAVATKKTMDKENGEGGEVGNMKAEIHRMHVRFGQLKKAEDKLIHDLDHCVSRRDAIITTNEAREKREKGASEKTRINFQRKLEDMRSKLKQMQTEVETLTKRIDASNDEEQRLMKEIAITQQDTAFAKRKIATLMENIEETKTGRQRNLELLVLKQKKLKVYSDLAKGRRPHLAYRTNEAISVEYDKQKQLNNSLINIAENLLSDFPLHVQVLTRISNTLKLPLLYLYK